MKLMGISALLVELCVSFIMICYVTDCHVITVVLQIVTCSIYLISCQIDNVAKAI